MIPKWLLAVVLLLVVLVASCGEVAAYTPQSGDYFTYYEEVDLGNGAGNYLGYSEHTVTTGTETFMGTGSNGTVSAHYAFAWTYDNSTGSTETGSESGDFTFSSITCRYLNGTDGQVGYVNPTVWFFVNTSTLASGTFFLLNTEMTVTSWNYSFYLPSQGRSVETVQAQGSSAYQRNDVYGIFNAFYTWTAYFDPDTGYIIGYSYTENDADSFGNGFTYTENLYVNTTSYPLTTAQTPPPSDGGSNTVLIAIGAVVALVVIVAVLMAYVSRKRRKTIPQHPTQRLPPTSYQPGSSPKDIEFNPKQPPVQQIVIHEVVKVKCRYCGALIDSTVEVCPQCGAPRT